MVQSRLELNPLTIAVSRDLETCFESMLKPLKSQLNKNPFCLSFLTDKSLLEMNFTSHACLSRFYGLIFRKFTTQTLPKFLSYGLSLPVYSHSLNIIPTSKSFFDDKYIKDTGQPVLYMRSIVKLNLQFGSKESIALLQSVAECNNIEIFKTPFINAYINDKWEALKGFM